MIQVTVLRVLVVFWLMPRYCCSFIVINRLGKCCSISS